MRQLRQLCQLFDSIPTWGLVAIGVFLVAVSTASIYGRLNPSLGRKLFSKIPPEEIQTNVGHIVQYTVVPVVVTISFFVLLFSRCTA